MKSEMNVAPESYIENTWSAEQECSVHSMVQLPTVPSKYRLLQYGIYFEEVFKDQWSVVDHTNNQKPCFVSTTVYNCRKISDCVFYIFTHNCFFVCLKRPMATYSF